MISLDPVILFFLLGLGAGLLRSELRLPSAIYEFLTALLLITIGLKGGVELAKQSLLGLLPEMVAVVAMGVILPLIAYPVLLKLGKFKRADSAAIAAHYGSVSVGTFAVAVAYLAHQEVSYEEYIPVFVVILEAPAIFVGIVLARGFSSKTDWNELTREVLLGKSVVLLLGGLLVGWLAGPAGVEPIAPLFFDLFKGVLALFLLEMGIVTASQFGSLKTHGVFLVVFAILMPLASSVMGGVLGLMLGLSPGGTMLLATLAASASYIAVPAAIRLAVPEANPTLSLTASLAVTFPFNILAGIPLYHALANILHGYGG